jgi:hypothetical protein
MCYRWGRQGGHTWALRQIRVIHCDGFEEETDSRHTACAGSENC